jgi:hypothetical protein
MDFYEHVGGDAACQAHGRFASLIVCVASVLGLACVRAEPASPGDSETARDIFTHDTLVAWPVYPSWDEKRTPEERAQLLEKLGIKNYASDYENYATDYDGRDKPTVDAEIEALNAHHINLVAWLFPFEPNDLAAKGTLEAFKRHGVHPQLWIAPSAGERTKQLERMLPNGIAMPKTTEEWEKLSKGDKSNISRIGAELCKKGLPRTPQEQIRRVRHEADRIYALAKLAGPYGSQVELYNTCGLHNWGGWYEMMDNQVAVIERLETLGVTGIGIVYNFSHARDELHDDSEEFPAIWHRIERYVVVVNVAKISLEGLHGHQKQSGRELQMLRTISESGWRGPIGFIDGPDDDAEFTLKDDIMWLDSLAAEMKQHVSGSVRSSQFDH